MSNFEKAVRPLVVFAIVTGVVSVVLDIVQDLSGFAEGVILLAAFGPALGAVAAWLSARGVLGAVLPQPVARRQVVAHLVLGVAAAAAFFGVLVLVTVLQGFSPVWPTAVAGIPIGVTVSGLLLAAVLQEAGWRGLAQPLLELSGSRMLATLVVGGLWGFWVVQLVPVASNFVAVTCVVLGMVALSVLLGHFGNGSVLQRVAASTIVHFLVALAALAVLGGGVISTAAAVAFFVAITVTAIVFMAMFFSAQRRRSRRRAAEQGAAVASDS